MSEDKIYLSSNLKFLRTTNGKSLDDVAKVVNKTKTAICYWEGGTREPNAVDLAKLCNYFGINIDDMLLKDLRFEDNVVLDEHHELDLLATEKAKTLSVEDKQWLINTMDMINKAKEQKEDNK